MGRYFTFDGISSRSEWWITQLAILGISSLFGLVVLVTLGIGIILLPVILVLTYWLGLAVSCRRWHERNKTGWWTLIMFAPIIGPFWFVIELGFLGPTRGPNRFASNLENTD